MVLSFNVVTFDQKYALFVKDITIKNRDNEKSYLIGMHPEKVIVKNLGSDDGAVANICGVNVVILNITLINPDIYTLPLKDKDMAELNRIYLPEDIIDQHNIIEKTIGYYPELVGASYESGIDEDIEYKVIGPIYVYTDENAYLGTEE